MRHCSWRGIQIPEQEIHLPSYSSSSFEVSVAVWWLLRLRKFTTLHPHVRRSTICEHFTAQGETADHTYVFNVGVS
jgi:hypothetical protein